MKIVGKISRSDVEGGMWILTTRDGEHYQLAGETDGLNDGDSTEVSGAVDRNMMGFGMGGATFVVKAIKVLNKAGKPDKKAKAKK
jgi:hypothetical protein